MDPGYPWWHSGTWEENFWKTQWPSDELAIKGWRLQLIDLDWHSHSLERFDEYIWKHGLLFRVCSNILLRN